MTVAFDAGSEDELEVEVVKGSVEAEFEFEVLRGELVLTEVSADREDDAETRDDDG